MNPGASPLRPGLPKRRFYNKGNGHCGSKADELPSIIKAAQSEAQPIIVSLKTNEVTSNSNCGKGENNNGDPNDDKGGKLSKLSFIGSVTKGASFCARISIEGAKFALGLPFYAIGAVVNVTGKLIQSVSPKYAAPEGDPIPSTTFEGQDKEKVEIPPTHQDVIGEVSGSCENVPCNPNGNDNAGDKVPYNEKALKISIWLLTLLLAVWLNKLKLYIFCKFLEIPLVMSIMGPILNNITSFLSTHPYLKLLAECIIPSSYFEGKIISYVRELIEKYVGKKND
uniref:Uncharacterized protein n=1 Tax=Polytomella parva TaxID=51329 RepID=A0A7S0YMS0_9CHLO|mmetsp:Transcript_28971/g.53239  ORF Transcript_28971/g.53239 Transcript_28971/m.53239 type:complete len:282 (+) Transcript_28971:63-908(+)